MVDTMVRRMNFALVLSFSLLAAVDMTWNETQWLGSGRMVVNDTARDIRMSSVEIKRSSREMLRILP